MSVEQNICFFLLLSGMQELTDYGDLDESAMDVDGPAALVYRFSRRKSDTKSDENSQSSKYLNFNCIYHLRSCEC